VKIVEMWEAGGFSMNMIVDAVQCTKRQVQYWCKRGDDLSNRKSTGRPCKVAQTLREEILEMIVENPHQNLRHIGDETDLSKETVRTVIREEGFRFIQPIVVPALTEDHKAYQRFFSDAILSNTKYLNNVVFSDESMVVSNARLDKLWRIPGEYIDQWVVEETANPYKRMVWGAIDRIGSPL
jgi:transposase